MRPEFTVLDPYKQDEFTRWEAIWQGTSHREVQAHPSYGMALTSPSERFLCAMAESAEGTVIFPFTVREAPVELRGGHRDAITPYGYGGAYLDGRVDSAWFWAQWDAWALDNHIIGVTIREHLFKDETLPVAGATISPLSNIVVDLDTPSEQAWNTYEGHLRRNIKKAQRQGVRFLLDDSCYDLESFHRLYTETMTDKDADDFYFFDYASLESFARGLKGAVVLTHALIDGEIVASQMQLLGARNAYYFLGGSNLAGRQARANNLLKHETINWLRDLGLRRYVLGGGMSEGDSLFRYKRAYSPRGQVTFTVTHHDTYPGASEDASIARRTQEPGWRPRPGFVPAYRAPGIHGGEPS